MYNLFLDESGILNLKDTGITLPHFSIAAILIHESDSIFLNERSKQIKFKYFGATDIVFHAYEIIKNEGDFEIFKNNSALKKEFISDIKNMLQSSNFKVIYVGLNKERYIENTPTISNLIKKGVSLKKYESSLTTRMVKVILKSYLCHLKNKSRHSKKCNGKVTIESSTEIKDNQFFSAYYSILGGCKELAMSNTDVRDHLTCISFATKKNNAIEVEIADMAAYCLNAKHRHEDKKSKEVNKTIQELVAIFQNKLFDNKCSNLPKSSWQDLSKMQKPPEGGLC